MMIAEFLLARITDTIATAREVQAQGVTDGLDPADPRSAALRLAAHVIAECEAKRRIVELFPNAAQNGDGWDEAGYSVLRDLAAVHADHPDHREEWRP